MNKAKFDSTYLNVQWLAFLHDPYYFPINVRVEM